MKYDTYHAYCVSIVTHNELRTSAPKSFDEVWVQDSTASSSWPGLSNETKNVHLTVTAFDFLGFKNSRGLHLSEERYLERFSCQIYNSFLYSVGHHSNAST